VSFSSESIELIIIIHQRARLARIGPCHRVRKPLVAPELACHPNRLRHA
jgi:hypothetical protein